jgi:hypothetical protein
MSLVVVVVKEPERGGAIADKRRLCRGIGGDALSALLGDAVGYKTPLQRDLLGRREWHE